MLPVLNLKRQISHGEKENLKDKENQCNVLLHHFRDINRFQDCKLGIDVLVYIVPIFITFLPVIYRVLYIK